MNPLDAALKWVLPGGRRMDLQGKVALITGGGDGIGLEAARQLVAKGAKVAVLDRSDGAAERAVTELGEDHALAIVADVTDRDAMSQAVAETVALFGRLDVVVANAGITPPPGTLRVLDPADFDKVLAVNLTGVYNTIQPAIEELITSKGHVVVVASAAAFSPPLGGAAYMISKAAVEVLARALRLELAAHEVTVTTSYFGIVETQLARATLNDDPLGPEIEAMLPPILRKRITAEQAAGTIITGIEQRASHTMAPFAWEPLGLMRGLLSPALDRYLTGSDKIHQLIHTVESERPQAR